MSARDDDDYQRNPVVRALVDANYARSPRLWLKPHQIVAMKAMARENAAEVQRIKDRVRAEISFKGGTHDRTD